ncbi:MAG: hypothetical protein RLZZ165_520, partial [Bacteroidota bacterium]
MASEKRTAKSSSNSKNFLRWPILVGLGLIVLVVAWTVISVVTNLPPLNDIENPKLDLSTQIYSADGQKLG